MFSGSVSQLFIWAEVRVEAIQAKRRQQLHPSPAPRTTNRLMVEPVRSIGGGGGGVLLICFEWGSAGSLQISFGPSLKKFSQAFFQTGAYIITFMTF